MSYHTDIDAIATWDRGNSGSIGRATGQRREPPSICRECGDEYPDRAFPDGTCGETACRDAQAQRPVDPWLVRTEVRA